MQKALTDDACKTVQRVALFDEFRPKSSTSGGLDAHEKSLAFRVTLQDTGGTRQDEKVEKAIKTMVESLARAHRARLRRFPVVVPPRLLLYSLFFYIHNI